MRSPIGVLFASPEAGDLFAEDFDQTARGNAFRVEFKERSGTTSRRLKCRSRARFEKQHATSGSESYERERVGVMASNYHQDQQGEQIDV